MVSMTTSVGKSSRVNNKSIGGVGLFEQAVVDIANRPKNRLVIHWVPTLVAASSRRCAPASGSWSLDADHVASFDIQQFFAG